MISASANKNDSDIAIGGANVVQFYRWDGSLLGDPIWITSETNQGHRPGIVALKNGDYLSVWQTNNPNSYPSLGDRKSYIVGRYIAVAGNNLDTTFVIDSDSVLLKEGDSPRLLETNEKISVSWIEYASPQDTQNYKNFSVDDISNIIREALIYSPKAFP